MIWYLSQRSCFNMSSLSNISTLKTAIIWQHYHIRQAASPHLHTLGYIVPTNWHHYQKIYGPSKTYGYLISLVVRSQRKDAERKQVKIGPRLPISHILISKLKMNGFLGAKFPTFFLIFIGFIFIILHSKCSGIILFW